MYIYLSDSCPLLDLIFDVHAVSVVVNFKHDQLGLRAGIGHIVLSVLLLIRAKSKSFTLQLLKERIQSTNYFSLSYSIVADQDTSSVQFISPEPRILLRRDLQCELGRFSQ